METDSKVKGGWRVFAALCAAAAVLGLAVHNPIFENDLFLQIRAGEEILRGHGVQRIDEWSSTALGRPWVNIEWLSTVVFNLWSRLAADDALMPTLRALLTAVLAVGAWSLTKRHGRGRPAWAGLEAFLVLPFFFMACRSSFQLRPDLLAVIVYVALLLRLTARVSDARKAIECVALLVLWANFHAGTVPLGIGVTCCWLVTPARGLTPARRALAAAAAVCAWFATPVGTHAAAVLWQHTGGYDWGVSSNDDQRPFSLEILDVRVHTFRYWWWLLLTFGSFACYVRKGRRGEGGEWPAENPYGNPLFVALGFVSLSLVTFFRIRAVAYPVLFCLPLAGAVVAEALEWLWRRLGDKSARLCAGLAVCVAWASPAGGALQDRLLLPSFGVYESQYPVHTVEFLKREKPKGLLYNTYDHGGYLVDRLREYPVALDSRELVYQDFLKDLNAVYSHPGRDRYAAFLRRHGFNTLVLAIPEIEEVPGRGYLDVYGSLAPASEWGLVFADNASLVYVRRVAEHEGLLSRHEYQLLYHGLPPDYAAKAAGLDPKLTAQFERELERCLVDVPSNVYCLLGKAAFLRKKGDLAAARELIGRAARQSPFDDDVARAVSELRVEAGAPLTSSPTPSPTLSH